MAFSIEDDLTMKIRKGTTGEFVIEDLPPDFNGMNARFVVKKTANSSDLEAPINKTSVIANGQITFGITKSDSDNLTVSSDDETSEYIWGVMVSNNDGTTCVNIIPEQFKEMPKCIVYPEIAGDN